MIKDEYTTIDTNFTPPDTSYDTTWFAEKVDSLHYFRYSLGGLVSNQVTSISLEALEFYPINPLCILKIPLTIGNEWKIAEWDSSANSPYFSINKIELGNWVNNSYYQYKISVFHDDDNLFYYGLDFISGIGVTREFDSWGFGSKALFFEGKNF